MDEDTISYFRKHGWELTLTNRLTKRRWCRLGVVVSGDIGILLTVIDRLNGELHRLREKQQGKVLAIPLDDELRENLGYLGMTPTEEPVTVPRWVMEYLADSSRHSGCLLVRIRGAWGELAADLATKGDDPRG